MLIDFDWTLAYSSPSKKDVLYFIVKRYHPDTSVRSFERKYELFRKMRNEIKPNLDLNTSIKKENELLIKIFNLSITPSELFNILDATLSKERWCLYKDSYVFLKEIKNLGIKIYVSTDSYYEYIAKKLRKFDIINFIDGIFTIDKIKLNKKTPKYFKKILNLIGVNPSEVFFISDDKNEVNSAKAVGIDAYKIERKKNPLFFLDFLKNHFNIKYKVIKISWKRLHIFIKDLYEKLVSSSFIPDSIVDVSRGGIVPALEFNKIFPYSSLIMLGIKRQLSEGIYHFKDKPMVYQRKLPSLKGKDVLLVDDVIRTGKTIGLAEKIVMNKRPHRLNVSTIFISDEFKDRIDEDKDKYIWSKVIRKDEWVIFPWEKEY